MKRAETKTAKGSEQKPLAGRVAVVAGATRGAGRGIARMLGEAGAVVYCTGRSSRGHERTHKHHYAARPETIEETAEMVTAAGGTGVAVRTDHTDEREVAELFKRVGREQRRLDVLVNVLTGQPVASCGPFWKQSVEQGREMVEGWLWPHVTTCWHAAPLMIKNRSGLVVEIVEQDTIGYHGQFFFDLFETCLKRLAYGLAVELAPKGVSAVAVTPGFMRTEAILEQFGATEENWQEVAETNKQAKRYGFAGSETPCFVGRAVAALASDPRVMEKSGGVFSSWGLSEEYGFTDIDGRRPHLGRYFAEHFPHLVNAPSPAGFNWTLTPNRDARRDEQAQTRPSTDAPAEETKRPRRK